MHAGQMTFSQRRGQRVGGVSVETPLIGMHVPVSRADHGPWWTRPIQRIGQRDPSGDRPAFLLTNVVCPAAAVTTHAAGQHQQAQDRPVRRIGMEPLADPGTHDDHRSTVGLLRVVGEFARHPNTCLRRHAGDLCLPGRRIRRRRVVIAGPHNRNAATQHRPRSIGRLEARQQHLDDLVVIDIANRESGLHTLQIQVQRPTPESA